MRPFTAIVLSALLAAPAGLCAEPASVTVRVLANDAKLIPGVQIVIRDADSGEVLDRGVTEGGTGDTARIIREPVEHGAQIFATEGAAAHLATLDLDEPSRVTIEGLQPETGAAASKILWLMPGRDVTGNGVVLRLYGLDVDIREPAGVGVSGKSMDVTARVEMLCGCPVTPGGLWDADGFTVTAALRRDGETVSGSVLEYAGEASLFTGTVDLPAPGAYTLRVTAEQPARGNFGVATLGVTAEEPN